jgi:thiol-disulfide isomerase/thioredoxin
MKTNQLIIITVVVALLAGAGVFFFSAKEANAPGALDGFTQCLKDRGAIFYGAFWCPHCQAQKKLFGASAKLLPYVECSTPDGNRQLQVCIDKGIKSYPTWVFADGTEQTGEIGLKQLADKSGCELPGDPSVAPEPESPSVSSSASSTPE